MKERLLRNWHPMRFLQLGMGVLFLVQGITRHDTIAIAAGVFFGAQAALNVGCCGIQRPSRIPASELREPGTIEYEEIT